MGCSNGKPEQKASESSEGKLLDKYTLGKVLGQGAFGIVYSCKKKGTKEEYAVKMIDKVETPLAEIKQEAEMLRKLEHPCVVKLHDVYYEKAFVCMVMDLYRGGDMIEGMQLHWKKLGMLPMSVVGNVSKQMIDSIAWLHQNHVVHRDVKGDNYLMDRKEIESPGCRIFLSDFGTVRELKDGVERLASKCGTKTYWAPEFFAMNYGLKIDVWAIGVVMYGLVTGRFPFKGEDDVKHKKIVIPPRSSKECGDLLNKLLQRKEEDRLSAQKAALHPFVQSARKHEDEKVEKVDFTPDVKESGANAGIAERRRELVGRLEEAAHVGTGRHQMLTLRELREKGSFEVIEKQAERTTKFEWWSEARAKADGVTNFVGAKVAAADEASGTTEGNSEEDIKKTLQDHKISTEGFGKGNTKTFGEFVHEVRNSASRLMIDASRHKNIVRVVDVVLLRIKYRAKDAKLFLIQTTETFPDGRGRSDVNQLPGTKKEPHENAMQTAHRIIRNRLQFPDARIKFDFTAREYFEEDEDSPSYPGVRTVYRKEIFEGTITTTDGKVLSKLGVSGGGQWSASDSKGYNRTFKWLTEKQCQDLKIKLQAKQEASDISALVHPPVGIGEDELKAFLQSNKVDVSKFGEGTNKSLKEFSDELVKGEAALIRQADGRIMRVVDIVIMKITRGTDVLVETVETVKSSKKVHNWLPAIKRRPDENMFLAAHRALAKVLKINENFIKMNPKEVLISEEEKSSAAYCDLPTVYRKRIISAEVLEESSTVI
eukprot:CAMPEP_0179020298 /NCGR_PEP_ID=MMETSP0796-20121207/5308_1 /TAXON_ID=73915 /ORGANISM="Pyrodinium bahamense, Strain pbaha01" /LENGTH=766 /DNA_ID=CAMNT_0020716105 /DNA_START=1 /DNA_END=2301 /DNA_ORIENTATION=-